MVDGSTVPSAEGDHAPTRAGKASAASQERPAHKGTYLLFKTALDWLAALVMLSIATPFVAGLAVLLKCTSSGPVLYSQTRLGRGGRTFRIHKLRTMTHGCEATTGPVWSVDNDSRVTRVGRWLRDTHLDELPQLWNVLRGEMSLIGPRPERPEIAAKIVVELPEFAHRLRVRPGITGLAQMRLPADRDLDTVREKLAHDLRYVESIGPALDVRIAVSTALHFVGWAAMAGSRGLVNPFAPPPVVQPPTVVSRPGLSLTIRDIGVSRAPAERDDLSIAA